MPIREWLARLLSRAQTSAPSPERPTSDFSELRDNYFTLAPPAGSDASKPWGAMMEIGYPDVVTTIVSFFDGTTSVFTTSGGGFFGGHFIDSVRLAGDRFLEQARANEAEMTRTTGYPQPDEGHVVFYLFTHQGVRTFGALEDELVTDSHPQYPLYVSGLTILHEYLQVEVENQKNND